MRKRKVTRQFVEVEYTAIGICPATMETMTATEWLPSYTPKSKVEKRFKAYFDEFGYTFIKVDATDQKKTMYSMDEEFFKEHAELIAGEEGEKHE